VLSLISLGSPWMPMMKVFNIDRHLYGMRLRVVRAASTKKRGGGATSNHPLKE
jgi:hypothetical protein